MMVVMNMHRWSMCTALCNDDSTNEDAQVVLARQGHYVRSIGVMSGPTINRLNPLSILGGNTFT